MTVLIKQNSITKVLIEKHQNIKMRNAAKMDKTKRGIIFELELFLNSK
jgi:hypothetical protein